MPEKQSSAISTAVSALRQRAEALLQAEPHEEPTLPTASVQSLVHELTVHQIELELQNEELRQAQVELSNTRDRYAELYEFAPVGYVTMDRDGRIFEANLTAANLFGAERNGLLKGNITKFVTHDAQDDCYFHRQAVFSSDEKQTCELAMHQMDGTPFAARLESLAIDRAGDRRCRTALINITERKWAEDALRQLNINVTQNLAEYQSVGQNVTLREMTEQDARERTAATAQLSLLTKREREVLDLVATGKPSKVIARELQISIKTVEMHRAKIKKKMHVNSVAELVRIALLAEQAGPVK